METPNHIAIIPDGNRRWAKAHRLNPWDGHAEGVGRFWDTADEAYAQGINFLTIWAGSYDNLKKRSKGEVNFLLRLLKDEVLKPELRERIHRNKSRVSVIGEWKEFVTDIKTIEAVESLERETAHYPANRLTLLFGYDGQREMLAATNTLVESGKKVTQENLRKSLWTAELPDVDLVIRTGGEPHWSAGFLMWQTANSQFYFTDILWPDFKKPELKKALVDYERRERRLGR